jgi:hypothetical protein
MDKIPTHKISELFHGEIASLLCVSENTQVPAINYAHRDDYYMFIFVFAVDCRRHIQTHKRQE